MSENYRFMEMFRDIVDQLKLQNLGYSGSIFTWTDKEKRCQGILKKLDRFLCNDALNYIYGHLKVTHLDWYSSNHMPICLSLESSSPSVRLNCGTRTCKFDEMCVTDGSIIAHDWGSKVERGGGTKAR